MFADHLLNTDLFVGTPKKTMIADMVNLAPDAMRPSPPSFYIVYFRDTAYELWLSPGSFSLGSHLGSAVFSFVTLGKQLNF